MITTTLANKILAYFFGQAKKIGEVEGGKCYLGLGTNNPDDNPVATNGKNFIEPNSATGYTRKQICIGESENSIKWTNLMGDVVNGKIENAKEITFNESKSEEDYTVYYFAIFQNETKQTNEEPLYFHRLTTEVNGQHVPSSVTVQKGDVLLFRAGALSLDFSQD